MLGLMVKLILGLTFTSDPAPVTLLVFSVDLRDPLAPRVLGVG